MTGFSLFSLAGKSTLILGIVALITFVAGRRWPSGCSVWKRVGIVTLLILPCVVGFVPTINLPVLSPAHPMPNSEQTEPASGIVSTFTTSTHSAEVKAPESLSGWSHANTNATTDDHSSTVIPTSSQAARSPSTPVMASILIGYGCVMIVLLMRLIGALRCMDRLRLTGSVMTEGEWLRLMANWTKSLKINRPVVIRVTDAVSVPMTFGWRSPVILIPHDCLQSSDQNQKEAILVHELTHIANADFFWKLLTQFMTTMYWGHPLAWLVRRNGDILRERICDRYCSQQLGPGSVCAGFD